MRSVASGLLEQLNLDGIVGIDFETYCANDFTLKSMATTEYITDPRFKAHMASVQWHNEKRARVLSAADFKVWVRDVDWKRTGMLGHHTHFDGLIASHHYKVKPAFYVDTLSMGRPTLPVTVGGSLDAMCKAFGLRGKKGSAVLLNTKGKRDLTPAEFKKMASYAGNDIEQTWLLFWKLLPYLPPKELFVIDATIKMYTRPRLLIDEAKVQALHDKEVKEKQATLKRLRVSATQLRSKASFAQLLIDEGVEPPMKLNKKEEWIYAFAKQDMEFKELLGHDSARVRALVRGRLRLSSSIVEKRAQRMARRAPLGPQPIYLNYAGALTWRWSGSDKINWQNMNRGSDLRSAIHAPKGYKLIIADSAQIEARLNACFAGQRDKVDQFRKHDRSHDDADDVYAMTASKIYGRLILKKKHPGERFVGKVADLSLGYQSGGKRFAHTLRAGLMGPPVDITDALAADNVTGWRQANHAIVASWRATINNMKSAFLSKTRIDHGCVAYEGVGKHGYMHLPNGTAIRYADIDVDDYGSMSYLAKLAKKKDGASHKRKKLYGGLGTENRTQALSRVLLADWIVDILDECPYAQLVMTTHDEAVFIAADRKANATLKAVVKTMTTPPVWMPDLPLAVDAHISQVYDKN